jgi:hypothetical protein
MTPLGPVFLVAGAAGFRHRASLRAERGKIARTSVHELLALGFKRGGLSLEITPILPDRGSRVGGFLRAARRKQMNEMRRMRGDGLSIRLDRS